MKYKSLPLVGTTWCSFRNSRVDRVRDDLDAAEVARFGIAQHFLANAESRRSLVGEHFWARGYFVSTVGRDEAVIRE
jgi:REP element-mobilizing transposase RayT